jgi:hypothetical protein
MIARFLALAFTGWLPCLALAAEPENAAAGFRFAAIGEQSLGLWESERPVLVYNHAPVAKPDMPGARPRSCYFHPVYGLDGEVLTDDFPKDHLYHRGMYWAWPHIKIGEKEYETWTAPTGLAVQFVRWGEKEASDKTAHWGIENGWFIGEKCVVREELRLTVHAAQAESRAIDIEVRWTPLDEPLTLWGAEGKSYGGFNFRFAPRARPTITIPAGSKLEGVITAEGRVSGDLVVTRLPWADLSGDFGGSKGQSGAAIFVHPQHRDYPPTWMARHYGLVSVGWPGVTPQTFPVGETFSCRYRVWIHRGLPPAEEIARAYEEYRQ